MADDDDSYFFQAPAYSQDRVQELIRRTIESSLASGLLTEDIDSGGVRRPGPRLVGARKDNDMLLPSEEEEDSDVSAGLNRLIKNAVKNFNAATIEHRPELQDSGAPPLFLVPHDAPDMPVLKDKYVAQTIDAELVKTFGPSLIRRLFGEVPTSSMQQGPDVMEAQLMRMLQSEDNGVRILPNIHELQTLEEYYAAKMTTEKSLLVDPDTYSGILVLEDIRKTFSAVDDALDRGTKATEDSDFQMLLLSDLLKDPVIGETSLVSDILNITRPNELSLSSQDANSFIQTLKTKSIFQFGAKAGVYSISRSAIRDGRTSGYKNAKDDVSAIEWLSDFKKLQALYNLYTAIYRQFLVICTVLYGINTSTFAQPSQNAVIKDLARGFGSGDSTPNVGLHLVQQESSIIDQIRQAGGSNIPFERLDVIHKTVTSHVGSLVAHNLPGLAMMMMEFDEDKMEFDLSVLGENDFRMFSKSAGYFDLTTTYQAYMNFRSAIVRDRMSILTNNPTNMEYKRFNTTMTVIGEEDQQEVTEVHTTHLQTFTELADILLDVEPQTQHLISQIKKFALSIQISGNSLIKLKNSIYRVFLSIIFGLDVRKFFTVVFGHENPHVDAPANIKELKVFRARLMETLSEHGEQANTPQRLMHDLLTEFGESPNNFDYVKFTKLLMAIFRGQGPPLIRRQVFKEHLQFIVDDLDDETVESIFNTRLELMDVKDLVKGDLNMFQEQTDLVDYGRITDVIGTSEEFDRLHDLRFEVTESVHEKQMTFQVKNHDDGDDIETHSEPSTFTVDSFYRALLFPDKGEERHHRAVLIVPSVSKDLVAIIETESETSRGKVGIIATVKKLNVFQIFSTMTTKAFEQKLQGDEVLFPKKQMIKITKKPLTHLKNIKDKEDKEEYMARFFADLPYSEILRDPSPPMPVEKVYMVMPAESLREYRFRAASQIVAVQDYSWRGKFRVLALQPGYALVISNKSIAIQTKDVNNHFATYDVHPTLVVNIEEGQEDEIESDDSDSGDEFVTSSASAADVVDDEDNENFEDFLLDTTLISRMEDLYPGHPKYRNAKRFIMIMTYLIWKDMLVHETHNGFNAYFENLLNVVKPTHPVMASLTNLTKENMNTLSMGEKHGNLMRKWMRAYLRISPKTITGTKRSRQVASSSSNSNSMSAHDDGTLVAATAPNHSVSDIVPETVRILKHQDGISEDPFSKSLLQYKATASDVKIVVDDVNTAQAKLEIAFPYSPIARVDALLEIWRKNMEITPASSTKNFLLHFAVLTKYNLHMAKEEQDLGMVPVEIRKSPHRIRFAVVSHDGIISVNAIPTFKESSDVHPSNVFTFKEGENDSSWTLDRSRQHTI